MTQLSTYSLVFHCCLNLDKIVERNKKMGSTSWDFSEQIGKI